MAYYPAELGVLEPALMVDEEMDEMVRVGLDMNGESEINLYSRYAAPQPNDLRDEFTGQLQGFDEYMLQHSGTHHHHNHHHHHSAIPMPLPGYADPPLSEPDAYIDTPYQLKTLGPSLSSYHERDYEDPSGLSGTENVVHPTNSSSSEEIEVKQSDSSESQAYYGTENVVSELRMEYVRWFYKNEGDRKWTPFTGYDSMRIEARHRELCLKEEEELGRDVSTSGGSSNVVNSSLPGVPHPTTDMESSFERLGYSSATNISSGYLYQSTGSINASTDLSASSYRSYGPQTESSGKRSYKSFTRKIKEWSMNGSNSGAGSSSTSSTQGNFPSPNKHTNEPTASSSSRQRAQWPPVPPPNDSENIIVVRGGLYEVDLEHNVCYASYWPDLCQITRGTWFYDGLWQPIHWTQADQLETEHLEKFGGASLITPTDSLAESPTKKNKQVVHRVSFSDFHVDWSSATEIHLYSKAVPHKLMRSVGQKLGFQTGGHRICRGFFKQCMLSDRPAEINHIVFVVHGIGQKMDTGRIVRNCAAFRECVAALKKQFYPLSELSRQKAEFFPVEWRSAAKLDGDIVDAITPHKLLGLRQMLNATAMDIMYYTSPLYRTEIQNALRSELNRIYSNFVKRNPNFEARGGKVSVLAHSLGAVITYDIMTGYISPLRSDCPELRSIELNGVDQSEEINQQGILVIDDITSDKMPEQPRLLFKLEHFFCLGSPLAVFLALRYKEPHNPDLRSYILPPTLCKRVYNVFHPSDPVAYRLEPLLNKAYMKIAPLVIHSTGSTSKLKYDEMEKELISREPANQNASSKTGGTTSDEVFPGAFATSSSSQPSSSKKKSGGGGGGGGGMVANAAQNMKSPPTPSKDSNWSWFNLIKYWKNSDQPDGNQGGNPNEMPCGSSGMTDLQQRHKLDESMDPSNYGYHPHHHHQAMPAYEETSREGNEENMGKPAMAAAAIPPVPNDLEYRMDYVLRESNLSSSYLAALTSHTSYWNTPDVAFFVLTHLYNGTLESQLDGH